MTQSRLKKLYASLCAIHDRIDTVTDQYVEYGEVACEPFNVLNQLEEAALLIEGAYRNISTHINEKEG
jgi:hypothetical protein